MPSFEDYKKEYKEARAEERKNLKLYMDPFTKKGYFLDGYAAVFGGTSGRGRSNYTNNKTISKYDLSNWMWLTFEKNEKTHIKCVTIYFQSLNYDKITKNRHALFDRLSFDFSVKKSRKSKKYFYKSKMFPTNIDLPLTKGSRKRLLTELEDTINKETTFKNWTFPTLGE